MYVRPATFSSLHVIYALTFLTFSNYFRQLKKELFRHFPNYFGPFYALFFVILKRLKSRQQLDNVKIQKIFPAAHTVTHLQTFLSSMTQIKDEVFLNVS